MPFGAFNYMKDKQFKKLCTYPRKWKVWLEELADKKGHDVNAEIKEAIREHLKNEGYEL
jgi:hypothetical protein